MTSRARGTAPRASDAIWITVALAVTAGAAELGVLAVRRFVLGHFVFTGWQTVWTTPASYVLLMLPLGILLALLSALMPRVVRPAVVIFLPAFVAAGAVAWLFVPKIHPAAAALLAAGVAAQTARAGAGFARRARGYAIGMACLFGLGALIVHGGRMARELHRMSSLRATESETTSVLLVVLDAVRAQNLSLYGYPRPTTPRLAAFAAGGIAFDAAYSTAPWTLTSHATMLTGLYPDEIQANWRTPLEQNPPTLAEVLSRRGFATGGFVANVAYTSRETGLARGFAHYEDYLVSPGELLEASSLGRNVFNSPRLRPLIGYYDIPGRRDAAAITRRFLRWQAGLGSRPFFALLNLYDAHEPYLPPPPFDSLARGPRDLGMIRVMANSHGRMAERDAKQQMPPDERAAEEGAYDGAIASIDDVLARTFAELERRGTLGRTLVIITADHGEQFGEHGLYSHANSLYLPVLHVPLVMVMTGRLAAGQRAAAPVTLRDLPATILSLVSPQDSAALPGHAFVGADGMAVATASPVMSHILPPPQQPDRYLTAHGEMFSLIGGGWHYIKGPQGAESLFDIGRDTAELTNLAAQPQNAARRDSLRLALDAAVRRR